MKVNSEEFNPQNFLEDLQKKRDEADQKLRFQKERLKQKILKAWHQYKSIFFWEQAFRCVPFEIMEQTYQNVLQLEASGYPVKSHAGLFVNTLKKMGYFPFTKEEKSDEGGQAGSDINVPSEKKGSD